MSAVELSVRALAPARRRSSTIRSSVGWALNCGGTVVGMIHARATVRCESEIAWRNRSDTGYIRPLLLARSGWRWTAHVGVVLERRLPDRERAPDTVQDGGG